MTDRSPLSTYRVMWKLTENSPEVYKTFGLSNDQALYTCVRALSGCFPAKMHTFEAHCINTDGTVRVIHGESAQPKGTSADVKIVPKENVLADFIKKTEELTVKEESTPTYPYEIWSLPLKGERKMISAGAS